MQVLMNGVEVKLQRNALSVLEAPTILAAAAGHNSVIVFLALYALLKPATGLLHRRFGPRPVVVMLAGRTTPLMH
jgi:hypothetical protein